MYRTDVRKQRIRVRYWLVSYILSFFFNIAEKNLLIVTSVAKMASTVYETENCPSDLTSFSEARPQTMTISLRLNEVQARTNEKRALRKAQVQEILMDHLKYKGAFLNWGDLDQNR